MLFQNTFSRKFNMDLKRIQLLEQQEVNFQESVLFIHSLVNQVRQTRSLRVLPTPD